MSKLDYFIQDYKFNLNIRTADEIYMGSAFITFSNIPSSKYIILNCDENIIIKSVRHRGKDIPFNYNQFTRTLHISCQFDINIPNSNSSNDNDSDNSNKSNETTTTTATISPNTTENSSFILGISFESPLNPDFKGFSYIDDETAVLRLFPNFSSHFVPCDLFTSEDGDINDTENNEFSFKISNISMNITPGESSQIAACSIPFPQISDFIQNRKMFRFLPKKVPLPFFSIVIGNYQKVERKLDIGLEIHFFIDSHIDQNKLESLIDFFEKVTLKIERALNLKPFQNCIQVADVYGFPQDESNAAGIVLFDPDTLNEFDKNGHFIAKQLIKQFLPAFPATVNENWVIEGLSSFLALVIMHSIQSENEKKDQIKGQNLNQSENENENLNQTEIENQNLNQTEIENQNLNQTDINNQNLNKTEIENQDNEKNILNQTDKTDENEFCDHSLIEIDEDYYQYKFFRVILNADSSPHSNSLSSRISLIDDDTLFESIYTHKSTCLFRMLFLNKTFEYLRGSLEKLKGESFTIEIFFDAFNCIQSEPYFESYFKNPGYPIIIVDDGLTIHQTRFSFSRNSTDFLWQIPLKITVLSISEKGIDEEKTVSLLFDKKDLDLNDLLNVKDFSQKLIVLNPSCETLCRVWYRDSWLKKFGENAENLVKTKFKGDLFNVFMDSTALSEMGFVDKKLLDPFKMFQIPQELKRRFPMSRGNGSILASFQ